jgi:hypothetical protein
MRMPFLVSRHLVYPLQEKAFHRPTFPYLARLEKSQWLSREGVEQLQLEKLRALLAVARDHCPWHRQRLEAAKLNPENLGSLADLRRLPTMDKADGRGPPGATGLEGRARGRLPVQHRRLQRPAADLLLRPLPARPPTPPAACAPGAGGAWTWASPRSTSGVPRSS